MRFLVIMLKQTEKDGDYYELPLGVLYISAALKKENFDVKCLNLNHTDESPGEVLKRVIVSENIDVVCAGGLCLDFIQIKTIFTIAKELSKEIITISGGGLIYSEPELMLNSMPMDFGVIGEGEETIVELAKAIENGSEFKNIKGLIFRDKEGNTLKNALRPQIKNIDTIPMPDYEGFDIGKHLDSVRCNDHIYSTIQDSHRSLPVIASRGCPFRCTFCFHPLGPKYRQRSLDSFFHELDFLVEKYDLNTIEVLDEVFTINPKRLDEFCERIRPYNLKWYALIRADSKITFDTLVRLKEAGLWALGCGLESPSDTILSSMKKRVTISQIERVYSQAKKAGIAPVGNIIFGDPEETKETKKETLNWIKNHPQYDIFIYPLHPFPGTEVYEYCIEKKLIPDRLEYIKKGCPPLNMTTLNEFEYARFFYEAQKLTYGFRKFARVVNLKKEGFDETKKKVLYIVDLECPYCSCQATYRHFHVYDMRILRVLCRSCIRVMYLSPSAFDHIKEKANIFKERLFDITKNGRSIAVSPCLFTPDFIQQMWHVLEIDAKKLNIRYFLDDNPRSGMVSEKYSVLKRTKENITKKCKDHIFMVVPFFPYKHIVKELRDDIGVPEENLVYVEQ